MKALALLTLCQAIPLEPESSQAGIQHQPMPPLEATELVEPKSGSEPPPVRLSDLVEVNGVRTNQLVGVGVVVGLNGTGDGTTATRLALSNFIRRFHLNVDPRQVSSGNAALVSVTATLPPFAKAGTTLDVKVSAIGDAESLFGGELLQAPLRGADERTYVVAQGPVLVGGFSASGQAASVTRNHPTAGIVTSGGIVEREVEMDLLPRSGDLVLHLRTPNYVTAHRISQTLNQRFPGRARAVDAATIRLQVPEADRKDPVALMAWLAEERVVPGEEAVVVINERTGTIVAGRHVRISAAAITHGNLTVSIAESAAVSQPLPYTRRGETTEVPRTELDASVEDRGFQLVGGATVSELAASLNRLGVTSRDLVLIFQSLKRQGALHARLEIL